MKVVHNGKEVNFHINSLIHRQRLRKSDNYKNCSNYTLPYNPSEYRDCILCLKESMYEICISSKKSISLCDNFRPKDILQ